MKHRFRESALLKVITKKPIIAQPEEQQRNPRSRSAKLRFAEQFIEEEKKSAHIKFLSKNAK